MKSSVWNKEVIVHQPRFGGFLQSYAWGEFQASLGKEVRRLHLVHGAKELHVLAIKEPLPFGQHYWYIPKGPLGEYSSVQFERLAEELGGVFIRHEAGEVYGERTIDRQPSTTRILHLAKTSDALLGDMKAKTRYNIRLSEKKQVTVRDSTEEIDVQTFVTLLSQTTVRDRFAGHSARYYKQLVNTVSDSETHAFVSIAEYQDRPIAAAIAVDFAGTRTYLHGASSNLHRNVMAPYGLQWHLIQGAQRKGLLRYDFWGIAPTGSHDSHPWQGITRFKDGFGGEVVSMPGTFDVPIAPLAFSFYKAARKLRRLF
ncbi:MAG: peptidoglycan bridge formation glycyltransferase FemA/FemB family protein [bacterium]|nr:peptidoglycan bridge formation glycyltransferase FemA/FemB family protein [bacterium]MDA1024490.1 peptidoglycan bridge formation glycyltransferase FemA/FemB family protein [bacterium]